VVCTEGSFNDGLGFISTVLRVRPWHRYAIVETPIGSRWGIAGQSRLMRPNIAVMLNVKPMHIHQFGSVAAVAAEKARLFNYVPNDGIIVANADCPHVVESLAGKPQKTLWYGKAENADMRIEKCSANWPERLQLALSYQQQTFNVATRLVGEHWSGSVCAALAVALTCDIDSKSALATISRMEPNWARMQAIELPQFGATIIRDERNAAIATFDAAFTVMANASAKRKIGVLGSYSEIKDTAEDRAEYLVAKAAPLFDIILFVDDVAETGVAAALRHGMAESAVAGFDNAAAAGEHLRSILQPGDLVLLKGRRRQHMSRAYLQLIGNVTCNWNQCGLALICDRCDHLGFRWSPQLDGLMCPPDDRF
jgi:UDP-N-acetylmuramoyl-tripeptide--D-alanyl-D-alanine ligase